MADVQEAVRWVKERTDPAEADGLGAIFPPMVYLLIVFKALGYRVLIAGKTHIGPRDAFPFEYLPDSNVLVTRFLREHFVGEVVDFIAFGTLASKYPGQER